MVLHHIRSKAQILSKAYKALLDLALGLTSLELITSYHFLTLKTSMAILFKHNKHVQVKPLSFTVLCLEQTFFTTQSYAYLPHFFIATITSNISF